MSERAARIIGLVGALLIVLTIPIYFIDLMAVSPAVDHCPAQPGDNRDIVLWVFAAGILLWFVGLVLSIIAITQRASRPIGIIAAVLAVMIPFGAMFGAYLLLGGDCFIPADDVGLGAILQGLR
jgi:hypothetical protein